MPQPFFGKNALIILTAESIAAVHTAMGEIARLGGHIVHVYPPRVLIGEVPADAEPQVRALANVGRLYRNRVDLAEVEPFGPGVVQAVKGWNRGFAASFHALKSGRSSEGRSWGAPGYAAEGPVQPPPGRSSAGGAPGRPTTPGADTSAYLIGKVATSILLVEGTAPRYSFSQMERDTVVAEIQDGLGWLASCEPRARVSWFYEVNQVSLDLDPAHVADWSEDTWRDAAMAKLGYTPSWDGLEQYVRDRRAALGTEWAFAILVTRFPLWHFAYAFKPRVVVNYDLDGWGVDNLDRIIAHETAHIFGAADEYAESKCDCQERWGFLQVENGNCELGAEHHEPCIMSHNAWAMCPYTRAHLGWRDSNGDGIFDPLDRQRPLPPQPWWARWLARLRRLVGGRAAPTVG